MSKQSIRFRIMPFADLSFELLPGLLLAGAELKTHMRCRSLLFPLPWELCHGDGQNAHGRTSSLYLDLDEPFGMI